MYFQFRPLQFHTHQSLGEVGAAGDEIKGNSPSRESVLQQGTVDSIANHTLLHKCYLSCLQQFNIY